MKKKFLGLIMAICLIIPCGFIFTACFENETPPCEHYWEVKSEPSLQQSGNATCQYCLSEITFPKLNATDYEAVGDDDYKTYSYTKYDKTFKFAVSNFTFSFDGLGYCVTNYAGTRTNIVIPEKVMGDSGECDVTSIGASLFLNNTAITSVSLPSGVKKIYDNAFCGCTNLSSINLSSGLNEIGQNAFAGSGITEIAIPNSVNELGSNAFGGCSLLENVIIGDGVQIIKATSFQNCVLLESVKIGSNVQEIRENAFKGCSSLININFGNSRVNIYEEAFANCTSLSQIILPSDTAVIFDNSFSGCSSLNTVYYLGKFNDCTFNSVFDGLEGRIKADIYYYCENEPTPYDCVYVIGSINLWHFGDGNNAEKWNVQLTNNALNKVFTYKSTKVEISDAQWQALKESNYQEAFWWWSEGKLETITSSSTKEEFVSKLESYGNGNVWSFDFGNDESDKRVIAGSMNSPYIEIDGVVCVQGRTDIQMVTFNQDLTELYYDETNEFMTISYTYGLYVPEN